MAIKGFGVFTLVYNNLFTCIISTILFTFYGLKMHRPSFVFKFSAIKEFLNFGVFQVAQNILNYLSTK